MLYNKVAKNCRNNKICLFLNSTEIPHVHTYKHLLVFTETLELPMRLSGKKSACQCRCGFHPWVGKIPWRREWQPTPILLPEKSHGQKSLESCSPWFTKSWTQLGDYYFHWHNTRIFTCIISFK